MTKKKLWIDDERPTPSSFTHRASTFEEAKVLLENEDWDVVSFDHDLGTEKIEENGQTLMNILEEAVYFGDRDAPEILIHTGNGAVRRIMGVIAERIMSFKNPK